METETEAWKDDERFFFYFSYFHPLSDHSLVITCTLSLHMFYADEVNYFFLRSHFKAQNTNCLIQHSLKQKKLTDDTILRRQCLGRREAHGLQSGRRGLCEQFHSELYLIPCFWQTAWDLLHKGEKPNVHN